MHRCLELAAKGRGFVAPNPMVGAVLVYEDRVIGEGWHQVYGQAHAEVNCFNSVPAELKQLISLSTMYVSLEPCAHHGKTPPCAERIIRERVKKVVIANKDPFEKVGGKGIALLEAAGVEVETGMLEEEARWFNRRFFGFHEQQRPWIILKWAQSANGFMAPADRSRRQLSNESSQRLVHRWRSEEAAILVGTTTALSDNPRLTTRLWPGRQPLRLVLDRRLSLPPDLHLFSSEADTWLINEQKETETGNPRYLRVPFDETLLPGILHRLYLDGRTSLIVEGGARLLESFIAQGLWDEARVFHAPVTLEDGITAPVLTQSARQELVALGTDRLELYTPLHHRFVPGKKAASLFDL